LTVDRKRLFLKINSMDKKTEIKSNNKMKITKRDIAFFAFGIFTLFIIETIVDWEGNKKSFKDAYNTASGIESKE
jgi:hypothetical protein